MSPLDLDAVQARADTTERAINFLDRWRDETVLAMKSGYIAEPGELAALADARWSLERLPLLVAELRTAREAIFRYRDAVEILRHHGTPYRWHDAAWNQGLLIADNAGAAYDKVTGEVSD